MQSGLVKFLTCSLTGMIVIGMLIPMSSLAGGYSRYSHGCDYGSGGYHCYTHYRRSYYHRHYHHRHYDHHDDNAAGAAVTGLLVGGLIGALAVSSVSQPQYASQCYDKRVMVSRRTYWRAGQEYEKTGWTTKEFCQ